MKADTSLQSAIHSLHQLFTEAGPINFPADAALVAEHARRLNFPDPELAERVARFLAGPSSTVQKLPPSHEEVSAAFMALLLADEPAGQSPSASVAQWRSLVSSSARCFGASLSALFDVVQVDGPGYNPALLEPTPG